MGENNDLRINPNILENLSKKQNWKSLILSMIMKERLSELSIVDIAFETYSSPSSIKSHPKMWNQWIQ